MQASLPDEPDRRAIILARDEGGGGAGEYVFKVYPDVMTETRIHPETGKTLRRGVRAQTIRFGSITHVIKVPGWYPDDDSDTVHSGADLTESDAAFRELKTMPASAST